LYCDCGLDAPYIPCIGHAVVAKRKNKSRIYANKIIGPVVDVWSNACRIHNNPGTSIEAEFRLFFNEWDFEFLHHANEDS